MKRRAFILSLAATAFAQSAGHAQQSKKLPTIGLLGTATASVWTQWTTAFVQQLRELGWDEGRTVVIEYRWADGHPERFAEIAAEFARSNASVIVTTGAAVLAARQATSSIPIVFAAAPDPVGSGFVASLARPGGNVTGLSTQGTDLAGKRLELLREFAPGLRRLGILANADNPSSLNEMAEVEGAARKLGFDVMRLGIRRAEEIAPAVESLTGRADALFVGLDPIMIAHRSRINTLALTARLPTMHINREAVEAGGFMAYASNITDLFRRSAAVVDKILHGAKPADIPVEQATRFDLIVNLTTAKALGFTIPPTLLARADEVIE
jgi:putative ABC transport system substrate-binding protein